jgi:hypothetical protein
MKNIVRSLVVVLALTGAIASSYAKAPAAATASFTTATVSKTSAAPVPRCDPNAPGDCGLTSW